MKRPPFLLLLGISLFPAVNHSAPAQNPVGVPQPAPPRPNVPLILNGAPPPVPAGAPGSSNRGAEPEFLSKNYTIKLQTQAGSKPHTATLTTASPQISFSTQLGAEDLPTTVQLSGTLVEAAENRLILRFQLGATVPIVRSEVPSPGNPVQPAPGQRLGRHVEYSNESATGALHVTLGKPQTLLSGGDRT